MIINIYSDPSNRSKTGLAEIRLEFPDLNVRQILDLPFDNLYTRCRVADLITLDFLLIASICYVIDKTVPRKFALDNWTRDFEVVIPVSEPDLWNGVSNLFSEALSFLSGDIWQLSFFKPKEPIFINTITKRKHRKKVSSFITPSATCLFSGGLDSLAGAIDLLAQDKNTKIILVGHYDTAGPASSQKELFEAIKSEYPQRTELLQTRISHKPRPASKMTLRSRSLVFIALGLYVARAFGKEVPLYAPENGLIAINVPLTPSRVGSCSTRTMHPHFLSKITSVLKKVGIINPIINPFQLKTKGECIVECSNFTLLASLVNMSISCSHPTRRRYWQQKQAKNCGYCIPCLIRRTSLHTAGLDNGLLYGLDICAGQLKINSSLSSTNDLRALCSFLGMNKSNVELEKMITSVVSVKALTQYGAMLERGFNEIRAWLQNNASLEIKEAAGLIN